ncbi:MAG: hypothetical protein ABIY55_19495 [Kofleriaceae bacterium]
MKIMTRLVLGVALIAGCSSTEKTDIADATVNGQPFHIFREGPMPAAGVMTTLVIKPTTGVKPDEIRVWVGAAETPDAEKVVGEFDAGDGDFDFALTCPNPMPDSSMIYVEVTEGAVVTTTSVPIK